MRFLRAYFFRVICVFTAEAPSDLAASATDQEVAKDEKE
jgi:hypothetical protein